MTYYIDENGKTVKAKNYREAAEKLYGQGRSYQDKSYTTYVNVRRDESGAGWAEVDVYKPGDKIGTFYGVAACTPKKHVLRRIK